MTARRKFYVIGQPLQGGALFNAGQNDGYSTWLDASNVAQELAGDDRENRYMVLEYMMAFWQDQSPRVLSDADDMFARGNGP